MKFCDLVIISLVASLVPAACAQTAAAITPSDLNNDAAHKPTLALKRATILLAANDLDGAATSLTEALGNSLNAEEQTQALALATELAAKKGHKGNMGLQRAKALLAENDLDGANAAMADAFDGNYEKATQAVDLTREIAARKARQELSDEKKALYESLLRRGMTFPALEAADAAKKLAARPDKRAAEIEKIAAAKQTEWNAIEQSLRLTEQLIRARDYAAAEKHLEELGKADLTDLQRTEFAEFAAQTIPQNFSERTARVLDRDFLIGTTKVVIIAVGLLLVWLLARLARFIYTWAFWRCLNRSVLGVIEDKSDRGIGDLTLSTLAHKRRTTSFTTAGLFSIHITLVPRARIRRPESIPNPPEVPLDAFDALTGNLASSLSKFFCAWPRWWRANLPVWSARVAKTDTELVLTLTHRKSAANITSLECSCPANATFAQAYDFVEDAVHTMYYLIKNPKTDRSAASVAPNLRFAVDELELYAQAKGPNHLIKALDILQGAQRRAPRSFDAKLFEGIALDLLNRHDEAITRFQELREAADNYESIFFEEKIDAILLYNEAIAYLHCYTSASIRTAETLIDSCIGKTKSADNKTPAELLQHLARAAKANVIAHKILFWKKILNTNDMAIAKPDIEKWLNDVDAIVTQLKTIDTRSYADQGRRQVQWAIANADGNRHLNYANNFLGPSHSATNRVAFEQELEAAKVAFHQAERILPPLVETLTNLATVYLSLKDYERCRSYCDKAIKISPDYEYAYYRKAQSYDEQGQGPEAKIVIHTGPSPKIPKYKKLAEKYR